MSWAQACPLRRSKRQKRGRLRSVNRLPIEASKRPHPYISMVHEVCESRYMALEEQNAIPNKFVQTRNFTQEG
jgi:hypothetical protein